jgi:hypothetical protein
MPGWTLADVRELSVNEYSELVAWLRERQPASATDPEE